MVHSSTSSSHPTAQPAGSETSRTKRPGHCSDPSQPLCPSAAHEWGVGPPMPGNITSGTTQLLVPRTWWLPLRCQVKSLPLGQGRCHRLPSHSSASTHQRLSYLQPAPSSHPAPRLTAKVGGTTPKLQTLPTPSALPPGCLQASRLFLQRHKP